MTQFIFALLLFNQTGNLEAMQKYLLGYDSYNEGKYERAVQLFQEALEFDSTLIDVYGSYGQALIKCGYIDSAMIVYEELVKKYPNNALIHYNLAWIFIKKELYGEAEEEINRAINIDPTIPLYYYTRGIVNYYWKNEVKKAELDLYKAIEMQPNMYSAILVLGDLLEEQGKISEAHLIYGEAQRYKSETISEHYAHGEIAMRLENWQNALDNFLKVYQINPSYEDTRLNIAISYENIGDTENAITYYCEALEQNPDNASIYTSLGYLYEETDNLTAAKDIYIKALSLYEDSVGFYSDIARVYQQQQNDSTWIWARKALEKFPDESLPYSCISWLYLHLDSLDKAEKYARKALLIDSTSSYDWRDLGHIYYKIGLIDSAVACYNTAIKCDSLQMDSYVWLSYIFIETKQYRDAVNVCNTALRYDSTNMFILLDLGNVSMFLGDTTTASDYFIKTITLHPDCREAYRPLVNICIQRGGFEILKRELLHSIKKQLKYPTPFYTLSYIYGKEAKYDSALIMIKQAINLKSDDAVLHATAGNLHMTLRNYDNALKSFKKALDFNPSDSLSALATCEIYYRTGNYAKAKKKLTDLCAKHPNLAYAHYLLGMVYARDNNYSVVLKELRKYLQLAPDAENRRDVERMIREIEDLLGK